MITHDSVAVDNLLRGRILQDGGEAALEVLGQVLKDESARCLGQGAVQGPQKGGLVVLTLLVELGDDVLLHFRVLGCNAQNSSGTQSSSVAFVDGEENAGDVRGKATQSNTREV